MAGRDLNVRAPTSGGGGQLVNGPVMGCLVRSRRRSQRRVGRGGRGRARPPWDLDVGQVPSRSCPPTFPPRVLKGPLLHGSSGLFGTEGARTSMVKFHGRRLRHVRASSHHGDSLKAPAARAAHAAHARPVPTSPTQAAPHKAVPLVASGTLPRLQHRDSREA
jgi:hypothetical protein